MGITVLLVLLALVILVLAFVGVFGRFPDNWEWVGIVLAGGGIAMGTPSILQMIFGRPKLVSEYFRIVEKQDRSLVIFLKNPPLEKKSIWGKLGVRRETLQSLIISLQISEVGSGRILIPIMQTRIFSDDDPDNKGRGRIALPPTFHSPASVMIAMWVEKEKKVAIPGDRIRQSKLLSAGKYRVDVLLIPDGSPRKEFMHFIVGNTADELAWVRPNLSTQRKGGSQTGEV